MYLMIAPSGALYSVDAYFRRRREARKALLDGHTDFRFTRHKYASAQLALRLTQIHYCIIYFF